MREIFLTKNDDLSTRWPMADPRSCRFCCSEKFQGFGMGVLNHYPGYIYPPLKSNIENKYIPKQPNVGKEIHRLQTSYVCRYLSWFCGPFSGVYPVCTYVYIYMQTLDIVLTKQSGWS